MHDHEPDIDPAFDSLNTLPVRPPRWPLWLAGKSVALSVAALVAVYIIEGTMLPRLAQESEGLGLNVAAEMAVLHRLAFILPLAPLPGLFFGLSAFFSPGRRNAFAVLATATSILAFVFIVGVFLASLIPLYAAALNPQ